MDQFLYGFKLYGTVFSLFNLRVKKQLVHGGKYCIFSCYTPPKTYCIIEIKNFEANKKGNSMVH
jgi:hypothetical protein